MGERWPYFILKADGRLYETRNHKVTAKPVDFGPAFDLPPEFLTVLQAEQWLADQGIRGNVA